MYKYSYFDVNGSKILDSSGPHSHTPEIGSHVELLLSDGRRIVYQVTKVTRRFIHGQENEQVSRYRVDIE